jgi:hypothetical protein
MMPEDLYRLVEGSEPPISLRPGGSGLRPNA